MSTEISSEDYSNLLQRFHALKLLKFSTWEHVLLYAEHYQRCGSWARVASELGVSVEKAQLWGSLRDAMPWMVKAIQEKRINIGIAPYLKSLPESVAMGLLLRLESKEITVEQLRNQASELKRSR